MRCGMAFRLGLVGLCTSHPESWVPIIRELAAEKLVDNPEQYHFSVFYAALVLLALYAGLLYLYKKRRWSLDAVLLGALAAVSVEAAVNQMFPYQVLHAVEAENTQQNSAN